jgi:hypothetical protein
LRDAPSVSALVQLIAVAPPIMFGVELHKSFGGE